MVAFVQEAVAYAKQNGKEKALAEFSNRNGSFFRGVLYIYAYDYNGTTIAHPVNPEKIGVNRLEEKDAEGNLLHPRTSMDCIQLMARVLLPIPTSTPYTTTPSRRNSGMS